MQSLSRRQTLTLAFLAMLSPFLRLVPRRVAIFAGSASWLAPLFTIPTFLALAAILSRLLKAVPGQGLAQISCKLLGSLPGKFFVLLWSVWLCLHGGFLLRSGADRFIVTIFRDSDPWIFVAVMAVLVLIAGMGTVKTLARSAEIFRPLLIVVLVAVTLLALPDIHPEYILPVTGQDLLPCLTGSVMVTDAVCIVLLTAAFLAGYEESQTPFFRSFGRFILPVCLLAAAICAAVVGVFGSALTSRLTYPFFVMVRDLTVFDTIQRFEALVVGLWVLPDFILVTMEVLIASDNLMLIFNEEKIPHRVFYWRSGNKFVWLCVLGVVLSAVFIARDARQLTLWADVLIPSMNLALCFLFPLLLFVVGKLRKQL